MILTHLPSLFTNTSLLQKRMPYASQCLGMLSGDGGEGGRATLTHTPEVTTSMQSSGPGFQS